MLMMSDIRSTHSYDEIRYLHLQRGQRRTSGTIQDFDHHRRKRHLPRRRHRDRKEEYHVHHHRNLFQQHHQHVIHHSVSRRCTQHKYRNINLLLAQNLYWDQDLIFRNHHHQYLHLTLLLNRLQQQLYLTHKGDLSLTHQPLS